MPDVTVPPVADQPVVPLSKLPLVSRLPEVLMQLQSGNKPKSYVLLVFVFDLLPS